MSSRLRIEIVESKRPWRGQRWFVRTTWTANGQKAMHSELYRDRSDAVNLVEATLEGSICE